MSTMASQITSLTIVYSTVYSGAGQRKHQSFASLAFVRGIHRWPVNFPHKGPVAWKMFPFDDVIMIQIKSHESVNIFGPSTRSGYQSAGLLIQKINNTKWMIDWLARWHIFPIIWHHLDLFSWASKSVYHEISWIHEPARYRLSAILFRPQCIKTANYIPMFQSNNEWIANINRKLNVSNFYLKHTSGRHW